MVGYDPHHVKGTTTYYLGVQMYPSQGSLEYAFPFVWVHNVLRMQDHTYDARDVSRIVPKACREEMGVLLRYYSRLLLAEAAPTEFFMETYNINLPPPALDKYHRLCEVFEALGYSTIEQPQMTGKRKWLMRR
jgi:hypothetical protein